MVLLNSRRTCEYVLNRSKIQKIKNRKLIVKCGIDYTKHPENEIKSMFIYLPVRKTMGKSSQSQNNIQKVIDDLYTDERLFVNKIGGPYLFKRTPFRKTH